MMKGKRLFLTGGAGFIATALIKRLIDDNQLIIYDNLSRNSLKRSGLWDHANLKCIQGDVLDYDCLKRSIPQDTDIILHMAAVAGIDTVIKDPVRTMEVNMIGTYHLLRAAMELDILTKLERFVNFSTSEVFGINAFRVDEKTPTNLQPVGEARWTYSVSKIAGEHLVYSYHKHLGLRSVTIRPFNIYGPGQVGEGAIHVFIKRAIDNQDIQIHGDGDQIRSWCYIDDLIQGVMFCFQKEQAIGNVFNIGNPRGTITISSLAEKIVQLSGSESKIVHVPKTYVDVDLRIPNIEKAVKMLGYQPKFELEEGLKETIRWYRGETRR